MITQDDLRQLAYRVRTPRDYPAVRAQLREDNYGKEWCLTDIMRLEEEASSVLLDIVAGRSKGRSDPEQRVNVQVTLRSVNGEPWTYRKVRPSGPAPARMTDINGTQHHLPSQWEPHEYKFPAEFRVNLADDFDRNCALWLLFNYGWQAAQGGHKKRRHIDRISSRGDRWQLVEQAFENLHPELAPKGGNNVRQSTSQGQEKEEGQEQVVEAPAPRKRGRPRKVAQEATQ